MKRLPVMTASSEQVVTNTFRLTQISEYIAVFEFTHIQSLVCNPPISFTVTYQPLRGSWIASEPKSKILACLTINAEDSGLGPLAFFATTIDVAWQPVSPLQHDYCMCFQLCTIGGFALPSGKTEAMKYVQHTSPSHQHQQPQQPQPQQQQPQQQQWSLESRAEPLSNSSTMVSTSSASPSHHQQG